MSWDQLRENSFAYAVKECQRRNQEQQKCHAMDFKKSEN